MKRFIAAAFAALALALPAAAYDPTQVRPGTPIYQAPNGGVAAVSAPMVLGPFGVYSFSLATKDYDGSWKPFAEPPATYFGSLDPTGIASAMTTDPEFGDNLFDALAATAANLNVPAPASWPTITPPWVSKIGHTLQLYNPTPGGPQLPGNLAAAVADYYVAIETGTLTQAVYSGIIVNRDAGLDEILTQVQLYATEDKLWPALGHLTLPDLKTALHVEDAQTLPTLPN